jgi:hypothetical protein
VAELPPLKDVNNLSGEPKTPPSDNEGKGELDGGVAPATA